MDFSWNEEQQAIAELARRMFVELIDDSALKAFEKAGGDYHERAWQELSRAELLSLALSEGNGGGGMSELELSLLFREAGRSVAPLPLMEAVVLAALPLDRFGDAAQQALAGEAVGETPKVIGCWHELQSRELEAPAATLTRAGEGFVLRAEKTNVACARGASHYVVSAQLDGRPVALVVAADADGIEVEAQLATNIRPTYLVRFTDVALASDAIIGGEQAGEVVRWTAHRALCAQAALMHGVAQRALEYSAEYAAKRTQFGVPIGTFQAVGQRLADAWIDVQTMELALLKAAGDLAEGRDAELAVRRAKYFAADCGHRVVAAAQHIHGGMGFDRDYPLHRYFLTMKRYEFSAGGSAMQLGALGRLTSASPTDVPAPQ